MGFWVFLTQEGQEPGQDGFLVFLRDGEVDAPDSAGLRFVSHQEVDGHREGAYGEACRSLFSHPGRLDKEAYVRISLLFQPESHQIWLLYPAVCFVVR